MPTVGSRSVQPYLVINVQQLLIKAEGSASSACRLQGCQAGQVEGFRLCDCHGVAPLLPRSLICPACRGLRTKSGDYLRCTSTPTTHCLLTTQLRAVFHLLSCFLLHCTCPTGQAHAHTRVTTAMTRYMSGYCMLFSQ